MEVKRLFDTLYYQEENYPQHNAIAYKKNKTWHKYSTEQVIDVVTSISLGAINLGLKVGDKVAIISDSKPEWSFIDIALQQLGVVTIPLYPNSTEEDYTFICKDAEVKYAFLGDAEVYKKFKNIQHEITSLLGVYTFDEIEGEKHWKELISEDNETHKPHLIVQMKHIDENDLATIIYTSGTTGTPKGVMLSHKNIISNALGVQAAFGIVNDKYKALCFLPLCHVFARTEMYTYLLMGVSIYYGESIEAIGANLKEVKPNLFTTVPRLLEKIYDKIITKGYDLRGPKRWLFFWAVALANKFDPEKKLGPFYRLQLKIADKLIYAKWREAIGGNIEFIVSGAAALQPRLQKIFWAAGVKIVQGYGQTETSPGVALGHPFEDTFKPGCIGQLLQEVEVKIAEDGEILVKGPNVMMGYYNRPEITAETINSEGWLHTGDIGEMVEGKFLKITDRKKEMFKTSGGKYIAPQEVENILKESLYIEHVMVVGEGQKFPSALVLPNFEAVKDWCKLHNIEYRSDYDAAKHPKVIKKLYKEIDELNNLLAQYKKIKKFHTLGVPWSVESGELTPTLKLKRKNIKRNNQEIIDAFYN